jgi:glutamate/tyrosine decarboxylase-like PLP-dependent enzyme
MEAMRTHDVRWRNGRAFSLAYSAGADVLEVAELAYRSFSGENALNTDAFPSLRTMSEWVVNIGLGWTHAPEGAAGFMTSGGTESLILAVRAAVKRAEREGKTGPFNMVLPTSAHAALEKAASYFDVESRRISVGSDWRALPSDMAKAVDSHTVLVVASAPQYPQGVVDPVSDVAAIALSHNINCHVDACMGGVTLTFMEKAGLPLPLWDFRVPGVTSISIDLHKYGYTSKGAGLLLHANKKLRSDQTFMTDNWLGGLYGSSGILGTKSGGPIASAYAVMHYLGEEGYVNATLRARDTALKIARHIESSSDLILRAFPDTTLLALGARHPESLDVYKVADALGSRGWYVDRQGPPPSLHMTVGSVHADVVDEFLHDFDTSVSDAGASSDTSRGGSGAYGTM